MSNEQNAVQSGSHPLPQDVFKYAPDWARFATVNEAGFIYAHETQARFIDTTWFSAMRRQCLGQFDATHWRDSLTVREFPAPKLRTWRAEEVPVGAVLRVLGTDPRGKYIITQVSDGVVYIGLDKTASRAVHLDWFDDDDKWCWPHEQFDAAAWKPCGVLETEGAK